MLLTNSHAPQHNRDSLYYRDGRFIARANHPKSRNWKSYVPKLHACHIGLLPTAELIAHHHGGCIG